MDMYLQCSCVRRAKKKKTGKKKKRKKNTWQPDLDLTELSPSVALVFRGSLPLSLCSSCSSFLTKARAGR